MESPSAAAAATPTPTVGTTETPPSTSPPKRTAGLVRYPKGHQPEHLKRLRDDPERVQITKRTLMAELTRVLHKKDGALLADLAESIVKNAIKGNSACLSFLAERLAPVEQKGGDGGRVVFEGIKLEIVGGGGGEATRTSIALVRGSESQSGATPLDVPGTQDSASESHDSAPRDVTLE